MGTSTPTTIHGTVTRLVDPDPQRAIPARVFMRPDDPGVFRQLDGAQFTASGEIAVAADVTAHKVGDAVALDVASWALSAQASPPAIT